jgi:tRNA modification GTPase
MTSADTIVAMATPSGRGAVGIVRLSGAEVPRIAREILGMQPPPRRARLANFLDARGDSIDQGLALYFPSPQSFTGEHVLELQGHGGPLVMDLLLQRALELGCRMARPGEFSERAFLSGKIDIAQAEAVADLIGASTAAAAKAAVRSMRGEFSARIQELQMQLTELRAYVEAAIDFPDEEIDFLSAPAIGSRLAHIFGAFDSIAAAARQGALLREGLTVVIAGKPNAG